MFHLRVLFRTLIPAAALVLLLGGCIMPARPAEPTLAEPKPTAELPAEDLAAVVNRNANVRTGPSTDHAIAYWLAAGDAVTVVGRNEEGTWLRIEHQDRPGWIFAALADIAAEGAAELPADAPPAPAAAEPVPEPTVAPDPEPTVAVEPEPTPQPAPEPTPEPTREPQTETSDRVTATVTGAVVNLRRGPGTEHGINGQVRAGDALQATGRNAAGDWLLIVHPAATGEQVWIYAPLTDIDAAALQVLAIVSAVASGTPPAQESAVPTPPPAVAPEPEARTPQPPADCTRLHTVNPNETRLRQITDWFGLDLAATAALNGLAPDAPLTAGWQICLPDLAAPPSQAPAAQSQPAPAQGGPCFTRTGRSWPCPDIPNHPERAVTGVASDSITYHAPGTYDRSEHPGLTYDFMLQLEDRSGMWNWHMRDFEGCYDALRVLWGDVPETKGLTRVEVHLSDPIFGDEMAVDDLALEQISGFRFETNPLVPMPLDNSYVDRAWVQMRCFDERGRDPGDLICRIYPQTGNSGSIHLDAAVNHALAEVIGMLSRQTRASQYEWDHRSNQPYIPYLYPALPDGNPAGRGPCFEVTRAG